MTEKCEHCEKNETTVENKNNIFGVNLCDECHALHTELEEYAVKHDRQITPLD